MYSREVNGQALTIAASGWTWHDKFILQDYETGSLWWTGVGDNGVDHMTCISGPLQNSRTLRLDHFRGYWKSWISYYPDTKLLKAK